MNNITRIVNTGICTGCGACNLCKHITFKENEHGFYSPIIDEDCTECGNCVRACIYDPRRTDDEN